VCRLQPPDDSESRHKPDPGDADHPAPFRQVRVPAVNSDRIPSAIVCEAMGSLIKKRRKRMRKKKHKKMLKRTRWQRRAK